MKLTLFATILAASTLGGAAFAQVSDNQVAVETDWTVFVEDDPKECWSVSQPRETVNTRDGRVVAVRRGDIFLFVRFRPTESVAGEVTFTGGYPFASGSNVALEIAGSTYQLFTQGEWAWPASPAEDAAIVTAMKRGAEAVLTARSSRGTQTRDTFSLLGFTAAVEEAERRCAS